MQALVLASGSQYRAGLLARLGVEFQTISPDINESAHAGEFPAELAKRLASEKAHAVMNELHSGSNSDSQAETHGQTIIIASDQVASSGDTLLGKPMTIRNACQQLASMSGRTISFYTSLHLLDLKSLDHYTAQDVTCATLRELDADTIARYVEQDQPLDCAGSFKVESLGISLFESVSSDDPTALVGLPMIELCRGLRQFGVQIP